MSNVSAGLNLAGQLSSLTISNGTLTPVFDTDTSNYDANVDNSTTTVDLTAILADNSDELFIQGQMQASGVAKTISSLAVGVNTIIVDVATPSSGLTRTYTVTVNRAPGISMTASPGQVRISSGFDQVFTLVIDNDTLTGSVSAADIILGALFDSLSVGEVTRTSDDTITVQVYGNLSDTGTGTIIINENALTYSNSPLQAEVTVITDRASDSSSSSPEITTTILEDGTTVVLSTIATSTKDDETEKKTAKIVAGIIKEMALKAKDNETKGRNVVVEIKVKTESDTEAVEVEISAEAFRQLAETSSALLSVNTGIAVISFDEKAVETISSAEAEGDVNISVTKVDLNSLTEEARAIVGDKPVYDFSVKVGETTVSDFGGGYAQISVPYTPEPGENKDCIVVYYLDNEGNLKSVRGKYDETTGTVNFKTAHFSHFMIGYKEVSFNDVPEDAWYSKAVSFMAARSVVNGVGDASFAPQGIVTRADFLVMVMNAYIIEPDQDTVENFADAGNTYYTPYLAAAKKLGLVAGVGDNRYLPQESISRQDMFVILHRILDKLGELPEGSAIEDDVKLLPKTASTRAEAVYVLYNLLK